MITVILLVMKKSQRSSVCFVYKIGEGMFLQSFLPRLAPTVINFVVGLYEKIMKALYKWHMNSFIVSDLYWDIFLCQI